MPYNPNKQPTRIVETNIVWIIMIMIINNHLISECSKFAQKAYKTRHDGVGKVIYWELCKKFKFDYANKYMYNPASVLENKTHKLLRDFEIQTDHLILARRSVLIIIHNKNKIKWNKKRTCKIVVFAVPADHGVKLKESLKKYKYLDLAKELKKLWNRKLTVIPIVIGALGTVIKGLIKGLEDLEIRGRADLVCFGFFV